MVVTIEISKAIVIIADVPFPTQNIIIGASATLGRAFKTTKYGSNTLHAVSDDHRNTATITPRIVPKTNPNIVS